MTDPVGERPHMPDYGVETADWRALPWSWAGQRLTDARNYWVVTVSGSGRPHALPVWGVWHDGQKSFCFSCGPRSRKAANLAVNPQVSIAPESTIEAVSVQGRATVLMDAGRREEWIARYLGKYGPLDANLSADFLRENLIVEVAAEQVIAVIERENEFAERATRWRLA